MADSTRTPKEPVEPSGTVTDRERKIAQTFAPRARKPKQKPQPKPQ
jgi:hypothetical protein